MPHVTRFWPHWEGVKKLRLKIHIAFLDLMFTNETFHCINRLLSERPQHCWLVITLFYHIFLVKHIFKMPHQIFLIFLMKPWLYKYKNCPFRFFVENSKLALFWPKMVQNWPKYPNQCFLLIFSKWRIRFFSWSLGFINIKIGCFAFLSKIKNWPFFGQNLAIFGHKTWFL